MRKVCVVLVDRANYGRLARTIRAIADHPDLELQIVCAGSMLLPRFASPVDLVRAEYEVSGEVWCEVEGSRPATMARSIGLAVIQFTQEFERLKPDIVAIIGDRFEAMAAATAAATMGLFILHAQGGERSRCVDNKYRHMITKAADVHWPATQQAAENLLRMAEPPASIYGIGCPASDLAVDVDIEDDEDGKPTGPILCIYHPTTDELGTERKQMLEVLRALQCVPGTVRCWWPNVDAGSDEIGKAIRMWMEEYKEKGLNLDWFETVKNLPPDQYMHALANARCLCGNSSSFARDSSHFGTPCVLVGNRQHNREVGANVMRVPCEKTAIRFAVEAQLDHGRYPALSLYGDGEVSERIADALAAVDLSSRKELVLQ